MIWFLFLCMSFLALEYFLYRKRPQKFPPGPPGLPIVGNLFQLQSNQFEMYSKLRKEYGDIFSVNLGSLRSVVINEYKLVKEAQNQTAFAARPFSNFSKDENGITRVKDLPVGQNFQDHCYTIIGPFMKGPSLNPNRDITPQAATSFLVSGTGTLAAPAGLAGTAFFQSSKAVPAYPDLQVVQFAVADYCSITGDLNKLFGINEQVLKKWLNPGCVDKQLTTKNATNDAVFLVLWLGRPKSVGEVTLASSDPMVLPNTNPRYLNHPDDKEAMLEGFKKVVDLYENTKALNTPIYNVPVPGCESIAFKTDDYYRCVIERNSGSLYHHVGTNAMGAVVHSSNLTVIGTSKLRVIDASVMPKTPNGNTNAPTIMVGEKGAQMILDTYKN